jgi:hypothetical protein
MQHNSPVKICVSVAASFCLVAIAAGAAVSAPANGVPAKYQAAVGRMTKSGVMPASPNGEFNGNQPVTRYELVMILDRWAHYVEGSHKPLHRMTRPKPVLPANASASVRKAMTDLVVNGYLSAKCPLFSGTGSELVTANDVSGSITDVLIRISDRSLPVNDMTPE